MNCLGTPQVLPHAEPPKKAEPGGPHDRDRLEEVQRRVPAASGARPPLGEASSPSSPREAPRVS